MAFGRSYSQLKLISGPAVCREVPLTLRTNTDSVVF